VKVLVTRPLLQAEKTADRLRAEGHTPIIQPLLHVVPLNTPPPVVQPGGLVVTSANVIEPLRLSGALTDLLDVPVLTTGSATAEALQRAGFTDVDHVDGSALDIVADLPRWTGDKFGKLAAKSSPLVYAAAKDVAHDLSELGDQLGLTVVTWPVYETETADAFLPEVEALLIAGEIDAILLYSPRTAACFQRLHDDLPDQERVQGSLGALSCVVLSDAIKGMLKAPLRERSMVAAKPTEAALFDLLR